MLIKTLFAASAAASLIAGAAMAQDKQQPQTAPSEQTTPAADPQTTNSVPADAVTPSANVASATTTVDRSGATLTTEVITNGPVPDTKENRARYGSPLSHAGKLTPAKGN